MKDRKLLNIELGRAKPSEYASLPPSGAVLVLDNIRSAHNVGSACPPSPEIHKSALGAENSVPWEHADDTLSLVRRLREEGYLIISVEQTEHAVPLQDLRLDSDAPCAFVFGNEVDGVLQEVVDASDFALEIPQFGTKHSLNVSVSVGVVLWQYRLTKCHWHGH